MKKVITYGTFDLFHVGHLNIIKRAKALGDYLIVAVSSDAFNAQKGKKAYHSDHDRKLILDTLMKLFLRNLGIKKLKMFKNMM